jgi:hypothetical protein
MSYAVQPAKLIFDVKEWFQSSFSITNIGCSGCASIIVSLALLMSAYTFLGEPDFWGGFRYFAAAGVAAYFLITLVVYIVRKIQSNNTQARRATADALAILQGVQQHADYLSYKAHTAAQTLKAAAVDLQEDAFSPFWEAIERAAGELGECHTSCQWLTACAPKYDAVLRGREHNFPDCFQGIETLPDCRPLLEEFYRLVRLAQRDFRFANIWEHHKTRKVLIAGFATLGEAIRSLEATVERSIADLKKAIQERPLQALAMSPTGRVALRFVIPFP